METKKLLKVATKFICEKCDYNTSKLSSYKKHLTTAKHLGKHMETKKLLKVAEINNCEYCNKSYHNRSSLWKHKQKCGLDQCQSTNIEPENHYTCVLVRLHPRSGYLFRKRIPMKSIKGIIRDEKR